MYLVETKLGRFSMALNRVLDVLNPLLMTMVRESIRSVDHRVTNFQHLSSRHRSSDLATKHLEAKNSWQRTLGLTIQSEYCHGVTTEKLLSSPLHVFKSSLLRIGRDITYRKCHLQFIRGSRSSSPQQQYIPSNRRQFLQISWNSVYWNRPGLGDRTRDLRRPYLILPLKIFPPLPPPNLRDGPRKTLYRYSQSLHKTNNSEDELVGNSTRMALLISHASKLRRIARKSKIERFEFIYVYCLWLSLNLNSIAGTDAELAGQVFWQEREETNRLSTGKETTRWS